MEGVYPINAVCKVLGVSRSAYYAYKQGFTYVLSESKDLVSDEVSRVFKAHLNRYSSRRIVAEMRDRVFKVGRFEVRQRMKEKGNVQKSMSKNKDNKK